MSLRIDVFTLFPQQFDWLREARPLRNVLQSGELELRTFDLRDQGIGGYRQVDDPPYGGGAGMVIRVDVVCAALEAAYDAPIEQVRSERRVVVLAPVGRPFAEPVAMSLRRGRRDRAALRPVRGLRSARPRSHRDGGAVARPVRALGR